MNETKVFLLKMMAEADTPIEFFLAYKALRRLDLLGARQNVPQAQQVPQRQFQQGPLQGGPEIPSHMPPPLNPNLGGQGGPRPFREDELAPDYDQMGGRPLWEGA